MKKTVLTGILCAVGAAGLVIGAVLLHQAKSLPRRSDGSGYDAAAIALEEEKIRAKLKGEACINSQRMPERDAFYAFFVTDSLYSQIACTGEGYYTIGCPTQESLKRGICYTDAASSQTVYLCAKPECLHDGSDFCAATNQNYEVLQIVWYENVLYGIANKTTGDSEHPTEFVLLEYAPDGTGMQELAVLDNRGSAEFPELIAHRGALWITATVCTELDVSDPQLGIDGTLFHQYYEMFHYELAKSRLTLLAAGESRNTLSFSNLQADGEYVYVCAYGSVKEQENGMERGLYQIDAQSGAVQRLEQTPLNNYYFVADQRLFWITKAENASPETEDIYVLHMLEDGAETVRDVPRGDGYFTDGQYLYISRGDKELFVCDLDGNLLKEQTFSSVQREEDFAADRHCFACGNGILYHMRTEYYGYGILDEITYFETVPVADYLSGSKDFSEVLVLHEIDEASVMHRPS